MNIEPELAQRLEQVKDLPTPPGVALRLIETANDPNVSLARVADIIKTDPVIAAKIMRNANSAAYARAGSCRTLRDALVLLGLDATLMTALSFSLYLNFRDECPSGLDHELYWRRSLLAATASKSLGRALGRTDNETLFLAGLLQDIGILALNKLGNDLYQEAGKLQGDHTAMVDAERQQLNVGHAKIGAWLMQSWHLPEEIVNAIATSHNLWSDSGDALSRCVAISGPLADIWLSDTPRYTFRDLVRLAVVSLGLDHWQIGAIIEELRIQIPETEAMFDKNLIDREHGFKVLDEARELLDQRGAHDFVQLARAQRAASPNLSITLSNIRRRAEFRMLEQEFAAASLAGANVGVIVAGLDGLQQVVESQGSAAAERRSREAALLMLECSGACSVSVIARDQIVLWLDNSDFEATQSAASRVQEAFENETSELTGPNDFQLSVALGAAAMDEQHTHASLSELLNAAIGDAQFGEETVNEGDVALVQTV